MNLSKIQSYMDETQSIVAEIDILRASSMDYEICDCMVKLKLLSDEVGAKDVAIHADTIKNFLIENADDINLIHIQTRLNGLIKILRESIFAYYPYS